MRLRLWTASALVAAATVPVVTAAGKATTFGERSSTADDHRSWLLAGGVGRRHLLLRRRPVLRFPRRHPAQFPGAGHHHRSPRPGPGLRARPQLASGNVRHARSRGPGAARDARTAFTTGDNVYESGTAAQYANCYDPTWGRHKDRTRPAPGNHEYGTTGAAGAYSFKATAQANSEGAAPPTGC